VAAAGCGSTQRAQPPTGPSAPVDPEIASIGESVDPFVHNLQRAALASPLELVALIGDREIVHDASSVVPESALLTLPAVSLDHLEVTVAVESGRGRYLVWRNQWGETLSRTRSLEESALFDAVRRLASTCSAQIDPESR